MVADPLLSGVLRDHALCSTERRMSASANDATVVRGAGAAPPARGDGVIFSLLCRFADEYQSQSGRVSDTAVTLLLAVHPRYEFLKRLNRRGGGPQEDGNEARVLLWSAIGDDAGRVRLPLSDDARNAAFEQHSNECATLNDGALVRLMCSHRRFASILELMFSVSTRFPLHMRVNISL